MTPAPDEATLAGAAARDERRTLRVARAAWFSLLIAGPLWWLPARPEVAALAGLFLVDAYLVVLVSLTRQSSRLLRWGVQLPLAGYNIAVWFWPCAQHLTNPETPWSHAAPLPAKLALTAVLALAAACGTIAVNRLPPETPTRR